MLLKTRRYTLRDAMVIVVGLAIALAWRQSFLVTHELHFRLARPLNSPTNWYYSLWMQQWSPFLVMATMTGLALRAIPPRPCWDELRREPGWVAGVAASLSILVKSLEFLVLAALCSRGWSVPWDPGSFWHRLVGGLPEAGLFVALAWMTLVLIGQWRPGPDWVDRFGRLVGVLWIGYYLVHFTLGRFIL